MKTETEISDSKRRAIKAKLERALQKFYAPGHMLPLATDFEDGKELIEQVIEEI